MHIEHFSAIEKKLPRYTSKCKWLLSQNVGTWPDFQVIGCQQTIAILQNKQASEKTGPGMDLQKERKKGADIETLEQCGRVLRVYSASIGDDRGCCRLLGRSRLMWSQMNHNETQAGKVESKRY